MPEITSLATALKTLFTETADALAKDLGVIKPKTSVIKSTKHV